MLLSCQNIHPGFASAIANGQSFQSLQRINLSSLFSWPPQGHSTSKEIKNKKNNRNRQCSYCEVSSRCFAQYLPSHAEVHVGTGAVLNDFSGMFSLKGISEPDALLCCANADASVP